MPFIALIVGLILIGFGTDWNWYIVGGILFVSLGILGLSSKKEESLDEMQKKYHHNLMARMPKLPEETKE